MRNDKQVKLVHIAFCKKNPVLTSPKHFRGEKVFFFNLLFVSQRFITLAGGLGGNTGSKYFSSRLFLYTEITHSSHLYIMLLRRVFFATQKLNLKYLIIIFEFFFGSLCYLSRPFL